MDDDPAPWLHGCAQACHAFVTIEVFEWIFNVLVVLWAVAWVGLVCRIWVLCRRNRNGRR